MKSLLLAAACTRLLFGCGSSLPARYVLETNIDPYEYRRYQQTLDLEFPVEGNAGVGYTATYVRDTTNASVVLSTVFVTVYERAVGLTAEVRDRLDSLGTYEVAVQELESEYVWMLDGGADQWALWVSGRTVVKIGAPSGESVPDELAEAYLDLYPSDLDEHGRAREGTGSAGLSHRQEQEREEDTLEVPEHLREGAPR